MADESDVSFEKAVATLIFAIEGVNQGLEFIKLKANLLREAVEGQGTAVELVDDLFGTVRNLQEYTRHIQESLTLALSGPEEKAVMQRELERFEEHVRRLAGIELLRKLKIPGKPQ